MTMIWKRLSGLLLALAMVLAMLPCTAQPVLAAEKPEAPVRFPSGLASYDAMCPVCKKEVTWTPYNGENGSSNPLQGSGLTFHLYLDKDQTYPAGDCFLVSYRPTCLNLNGYNITAEVGAKYAFAGASTMNFIDTYGGSVVAGYSSNSAATALHINSTSAKYNIYGGTWTKTDASGSDACIARFSTKGGTMTLYEGAVLDSKGTGSSIIIGGGIATSGTLQKGLFETKGGQIKGDVLVGISGSTYTGCGAFHITGGTVNGKITSQNGASLTLAGGTVTGNVTAGAGTTLSLTKTPLLQDELTIAEDVAANITDLNTDARITVRTAGQNAAFTSPREDAGSLRKVFTAAEGAVLLGKDNAFYSFTAGAAVLDTENKATIYDTADKAVTAYRAENGFANGAYLLAGSENETFTLSGDAYIDAAGKAITVTGSGKLYGMDSGNDDYTGCVAWNLGENVVPQKDVVNPANGNRYLAITENGQLGYHRLQLAISKVNIRTTGEPGLYYTAEIGCDETLAKLVQGYGIALSAEKMPGRDFAQASDVKYTAFDRTSFVSQYANNVLSTNSCLLTGILKTTNGKAVNTQNAKHRVYANAYLQLDGESLPLMGDEKNMGKVDTDAGFDGLSLSLLRLLNAVNNSWHKYSTANKAVLRGFVAHWSDYAKPDTFPVFRNDIQVGFGRVDITPDYSVPLAGYGNTHKRMSTGVQDRIYATCIAITEESGQTLLLITQDTIATVWAVSARAAISEATGVPVDHIIISATHTHAAPDENSTLDVIQQTYKQDYLVWIAEAAVAAMADRGPAVASSGSTTLEKMNSVRHYLMADGTYAGDNFGSFTNNTIVEPAEQADKQFQVIRFAREGKQSVVMVNWQAHVTLGTNSSSTLITSCFVGTARDHFEKTTGDLFAYFTGACGNTNATSRISNQNRFSNYTQYGQILSQSAIDLIQTMDESHIAEFKTKTVTFTGQVDHSFEDKLDLAKEVQAVYNSQGLSAGNRLAKQYGFSSVYHCNGVIRRSSYGATRNMDISAFYLGDISFIAAPYEMFAAHGMFIKENTPGMTFVLTSANGKQGYIPTNKAYDYGCYESHTGNYARGTGDQLAQAYVDMLLELK